MVKLNISKHTVKEVSLDKEKLKDSVFKQIVEDSKLIFISEETKDNMKLYMKDPVRDNAKKLWQDLLIDAICILKINDKRERLYEDTKKIIEKKQNNFTKKFKKIRKISTYGIDEIAEYFDDFVKFESVLYGTGEFYRDHIHHVLQVWAVGIGLIAGVDPIKLNFSEDFSIADEMFHFEIEFAKEKEIGEADKKTEKWMISQSELWSMWTIIALCHDLGYPLEKASQINQKIKKIVSHFGCLSFNELNFNFDLLNGFIVDKFLNVVASKTVRGGSGCEKNNGFHKTDVQEKYHDKISKSLEEYKHGMFSGLLVFKKLTYFLETDYSPNNNSLSDEDLRQFFIRKEILRAICGHTCPKIYHLDVSTLSFLLIICDELQEWGRPRLEELISDRKDDEPEIEILKFETSKEDNIEQTSVHISFKYSKLSIDVDENDKITKKGSFREDNFVRPKYRNMNYLLRSAKGDINRKITFQWDTVFENMSYKYIFNSSNSSFEMVKATRENLVSKKEDEFHIYPTANAV